MATTSNLVGSWYMPSPGGGSDQVVITFLANGTFMVADKGDHARDPSGTSGLEYGTYTQGEGGLLNLTFSIDTDGDWGLSHAGITDATVSGDTLTLYGADGNILVDRLTSAPNSIVGSWFATPVGGGTDQIVFTFLADGTYLIADKGTVAHDPNGTSGIEWGTYTWDAGTGAFTFTNLVNTDGQWGLSHSNGEITTLVVSGDTLTAGNGSQGMPLTRITPIGSYFNGTSGNDVLGGTSSNDIFFGFAGNDRMVGLVGNDMIDGGAGVDTSAYLGNQEGYLVARTQTGLLVTAKLGGEEGVDTIANVERLEFANGHVAYDLDGNAGNVARILGAVFGASFVENEGYVAIGLQYADSGMSFEALMQLALNVRLGSSVTNHTAVVNLLYTNVLHHAPSASDLNTYVGMLDSHQVSVVGLGVLAAQSSFNAGSISLPALTASGLDYT